MLDNTWRVVYCTIVVDLQCFFGIIVVFSAPQGILGCLVYALTPTLDRWGFLTSLSFCIFRCSTFLLEACDWTAFPATAKHLCQHCSHTIWFPQETHIPIIHFRNLRLDFTIDLSVSFSFELLIPIHPSVCLSLKVFRVSRDVSSIKHVSTSLQQLPLIRSKDHVFLSSVSTASRGQAKPCVLIYDVTMTALYLFSEDDVV